MLALVVGIIAGTYSSIYVAAPLTEWIDSKMATRADVKKRLQAPARATSDVRARAGAVPRVCAWQPMLQLLRPLVKRPAPSHARSGVTRTAAAALLARGYADAAAGGRFLDPKLAHLTAPDGMLDRGEAVARLARRHAIAGARVRLRGLRRRRRDGRGADDGRAARPGRPRSCRCWRPVRRRVRAVRCRALARVQETGATLVVTCDCGSSDHERLDVLRGGGRRRRRHRPPPRARRLPCPPWRSSTRTGRGAASRTRGSPRSGWRSPSAPACAPSSGRRIDLRRVARPGRNRDHRRRGAARRGQPAARARGARGAVAGRAARHARARRDRRVRDRDADGRGRGLPPRAAHQRARAARQARPRARPPARRRATPRRAASPARSSSSRTRRKEVERGVLAEALEMLEDPALAALPAIVLAQAGLAPGGGRDRRRPARRALRQAHRGRGARGRDRTGLGAHARGLLRVTTPWPARATRWWSSADTTPPRASRSRPTASTPSATCSAEAVATHGRARPEGVARRRRPARARRAAGARRGRPRALRAVRAGQPRAARRHRLRARAVDQARCAAATSRRGSTSPASRMSCFGPDMGALAGTLGERARAGGRPQARHVGRRRGGRAASAGG